jgi:hypothetical protein
VRTFVQSLAAAAFLALPPAAMTTPLQAGPCEEAWAQVGLTYAWYIGTAATCPHASCLALLSAAGEHVLLATAHAITVCAI